MATKKSKGKKAPKKANGSATTRRGNLYEVSKKEPGELGPQATQVYDVIAKSGPISSADVATKLEGKLDTNQSAQRVVSFYISQFKHDGLIKVAKALATAA